MKTRSLLEIHVELAELDRLQALKDATPDVPPHWFVNALFDLQQTLAEHTPVAPQLTIKVSAGFGLGIGIAPGSRVLIHGPAGIITIESEDTK